MFSIAEVPDAEPITPRQGRSVVPLIITAFVLLASLKYVRGWLHGKYEWWVLIVVPLLVALLLGAAAYNQWRAARGSNYRAVKLPSVDLGEQLSFGDKAGVVVNLTNGMLGAGILAIPLAISRCGLLPGLGLLGLVCALSSWSLQLLIQTCLRTGKKSFSELAAAEGPAFTQLVDVASASLWFGVMVAYFILIGNTTARTIAYAAPPAMAWVTADHVKAGATALLLPLCLLRTMDALKYSSFMGMVCVLFIQITVFVEMGYLRRSFRTRARGACCRCRCERHRLPHRRYMADLPPPKMASLSLQSVLAVPTMAFTFSIHTLFPPAIARFSTRALEGSAWAMGVVTMLIILAFFASLGVCGTASESRARNPPGPAPCTQEADTSRRAAGYWQFGERVHPNLLTNYPDGPGVAASWIALALSLSFGFPLSAFVARSSVCSLLFPPGHRLDLPRHVRRPRTEPATFSFRLRPTCAAA